MRTIAVAMQKGGQAKTTTAAALIAGAACRGKNVLGIDFDAQQSLSFSLGADTSKPGIFELMTGHAEAKAVIQHTPQGSIIPGSLSLATLDKESSSLLLKKTLAGIKGYDLAVIDCPPGLGALLLNSLIAATDVLIPLQADILSLQGLTQLNHTIKQLQATLNPALKVCGVVITRYNGRSILSKEMADAIKARCEEMKLPYIEQPIREGIAVREAQARRQSIFEYAPKSKPAQDYLSLLDYIQL